jgi:CRISPR-associated protein Cmr1
MPIPKCPDVPALTGLDSNNIELKVHLVTPMFGGGVVAREVDQMHPIRETSIRGQLQFWWRATAGAKYDNSKTLHEAHSKIWGSTNLKSKIRIHVEQPNNKKSVSYEDITREFQPLKYALFPFAKNNQTDQAHGVKQGLTFSLRIQSVANELTPSQWQEVQIAIKAWINFGGLGSRTRRGCGSLYSKNYSFANSQSAQIWINDNGTDKILDWPTISKRSYCLPKLGETIAAWSESIRLMQYFRQGSDFGRNLGNKGDKHPGRSRFPEPDTIRRLTNRHDRKHQPSNKMPNGFPRAEFGLPIIFQFKDNRTDPEETTLIPDIDGAERFASPLILKPIACSEAEAFPAIIVLNGKRVQSCRLMLKNKQDIQNSKRVSIQSPSFKTIDPSPMNGHESAIDAFLAYAQKEGYLPN